MTSYSAGLIKSLGGDTKKAASVADMAIIDMSDNANKMGTSIESIQNAYQGFAKQNYTMLDNLKLGYGGTKQEMERLLEDAGKISGQKYDISNLSDVYNAIHVIQGDLGITGTTAKEASETLSGSFASMKAAFTDLMGNLALGENVGPSMQALVESIVTFVGSNLIPAIIRVFKSLPEAFGALMNSGAPEMVEKAVSAFDAAAPQLAETGADLVVKLGKGIIQALPTIMSVAGKLINAILKVVVGLPVLLMAKGLAAAGNFALGLLKGFAQMLGNIKAAIAKLLAPITGFISKVKNIFPINLGKIFGGIKLPHFKISGGKIPWGIGGAGVKPTVSIEWYAKGGIMTQPTLFGGGEAGHEAIVPLDPFWKKLEKMNTGNEITVNVYGAEGQSPVAIAEEVKRMLVREANQRRLAWL